MLLVTTAFRNVFRYRRRSIITAAAIAVGIICSIAMDSLLYGAAQDSNRNLIWYESGAGKFYAKGYFAEKEFYPTDFLIEEEQTAEVQNFCAAEHIACTPRYVTSAEVIFTEEYFPQAGSMTALLAGVNPRTDSSVYKTSSTLTAGDWFGIQADDTNKDADNVQNEPYEGVVLGSWLATDMKAEIGAICTIQCKGRGGFIQTFDVPVTGIIQTDNPAVNTGYMFVDLAYLDELLELEGAVTECAIAVDSFASTRTIAKRIPQLKAAFAETPSAQNKSIEFYSWEEDYKEILQLMNSKASIQNVMIALIFIIAAVGISNTMLMAVIERKNEIAMMKALGYAKNSVRFLFTCEGFFIGLAGTLFGLVLGAAVTHLLVTYGMDFSSNIEQMDLGYRISGIMRGAWHPSLMVLVSTASLAISVVCAYIPAGSMLKKETAELLR